MSNGVKIQEVVPENLRKQLSVAVRSIQWSYAIFWSLSTTQQGILEWADGYYNGDIKTRKTVQTMEVKADKMGLQRSEQLRELYASLLEGETDQQTKRPNASLSPEDLTDAEWYYLVCMSFVFNPGQGLPGRALANGQTIWLCNAQYADSKVFSRSLLAKSASIQTVVCFPHLGGVIELGVTDLVKEDLNLIQHIKTSLLEFSKPACSQKSSSPGNADDDKEPVCTNFDKEIIDTMSLDNFYSAKEELNFEKDNIEELHENIHEEYNLVNSPDDSSNGCDDHTHQTEDSFMLEGINNGGTSQVQSWHFIEDDFVQNSMNSSDCISQAFVDEKKVNSIGLKEIQECNHSKFSSLDIGSNDDLHYKRTISTVLKSSYRFIESQYLHGCHCKSSFVGWKKAGIVDGYGPIEKQHMLKKVLFTVPLMHASSNLKSEKESDEIDKKWEFGSDVLLDKTREEERYMVLKSIVPSITKIDKASILKDTIKYLKELEERVEELESFRDLTEIEARVTYPEMVEQTSDNYEVNKIDNGKKSWINKRKASDIDEIGPKSNKVCVPNDELPINVKVSLKQHEVLIDMRCPWREYLLLDIMNAMNNLHLDAHTVQSLTVDGILNLTMKSKFRGAAVASAGMIKQALSRVAPKI